MYKGKHTKPGSIKKPAVLLASLLLIFLVTVGGTLAYLVAETGTLTNKFTAGTVPNEVVEEIDKDNNKNNVAIKNIGTVDAYVRAEVVVTWVNKENDKMVYYTKPVKGTDYTISWIGTEEGGGWTAGKDGVYYYTSPVAAGAVTKPLFTGCALKGTAPEGYDLSVEVMAQTIQAKGMSGTTPVVVKTWGAERGGSVTGLSGKLLQIDEKISE